MGARGGWVGVLLVVAVLPLGAWVMLGGVALSPWWWVGLVVTISLGSVKGGGVGSGVDNKGGGVGWLVSWFWLGVGVWVGWWVVWLVVGVWVGGGLLG